jgi:hypothetical protein
VLSVPLDSSDTATEHHYYTVNLVTCINLHLPRDSLSTDPYADNTSSLKHDDTDNGKMTLPNWLRHNQKIIIEVDGTYSRGYLQLTLIGVWAFITLNKRGQIHSSIPLPNHAFDWQDRVDAQTLILGWQDISHFLGTAAHVSAALCQRPCPPILVKLFILNILTMPYGSPRTKKNIMDLRNSIHLKNSSLRNIEN